MRPIDFLDNMSYNWHEVIVLPDYKELYFSMVRATEKAISLLIDAQRRAEEAIISDEVHSGIIFLVEKHGDTAHSENKNGDSTKVSTYEKADSTDEQICTQPVVPS